MLSKGQSKLFLMPWITGDQILDLIMNLNDPRVPEILIFLCTIDITLVSNSAENMSDQSHENTRENIDIPLMKNPSALLKKANLLPPINISKVNKDAEVNISSKNIGK